jgi:hypothetical protein
MRYLFARTFPHNFLNVSSSFELLQGSNTAIISPSKAFSIYVCLWPTFLTVPKNDSQCELSQSVCLMNFSSHAIYLPLYIFNLALDTFSLKWGHIASHWGAFDRYSAFGKYSDPFTFEIDLNKYKSSSFYNLIGVHLWSIQLIGHDLQRCTPVYIRSHSWQCRSEQKLSHVVEDIVRSSETVLRLVSRHRSMEGYQLQHWRSPRTQWPPSFLNGRRLKPPRLFRELAIRPNCAIGGEGHWSGR